MKKLLLIALLFTATPALADKAIKDLERDNLKKAQDNILK